MKNITKTLLFFVLLLGCVSLNVLAEDEPFDSLVTATASQNTINDGESVTFTLNNMDFRISDGNSLGDMQITFYTEYYSQNGQLDSIYVPGIDTNTPYVEISLMAYDASGGWNDVVERRVVPANSPVIITRDEILAFNNQHNNGNFPSSMKMYISGNKSDQSYDYGKVTYMNFGSGVEFNYTFAENTSEYADFAGRLFFQGYLYYYYKGTDYPMIEYIRQDFTGVSYFDTNDLSVLMTEDNIEATRDFTLEFTQENTSSNVSNYSSIFVDGTNIELMDDTSDWQLIDSYYVLPITLKLNQSEVRTYTQAFKIKDGIDTSFDLEVGTFGPSGFASRTVKNTISITLPTYITNCC